MPPLHFFAVNVEVKGARQAWQYREEEDERSWVGRGGVSVLMIVPGGREVRAKAPL